MHTPEEVILKIAAVADAISRVSGEPGLELAGMIVSCLASRPELTDDFMKEGYSLFLDDRLDMRRDMSLSYRSMDDRVLDPSVLRGD